MDLRDLGNAQLWQLMEHLHQEVALRELNAPQGPTIRPPGTPAENRDPNVDDQEVIFLRGRGWEPSGQPPWPPTPPPDEDVGHLINYLATGLLLGTPRINTFSGEAMLGKTEVSFEQRYHEVQCVKDHYPESVVWESMVRSLKEAAADMAWYIGPSTVKVQVVGLCTSVVGSQLRFSIYSGAGIKTVLAVVISLYYPLVSGSVEYPMPYASCLAS